MTKDQFEDFLGSKNRKSRNTGAGSSLETLHLSAQKRRIVNWIRRKKKCTLAEVASYLEKKEEVVSPDLEALIEEGFLQVNQVEEIAYYFPTASKENRGKVSSLFLQDLIEE